jgi:hypothetical protein
MFGNRIASSLFHTREEVIEYFKVRVTRSKNLQNPINQGLRMKHKNYLAMACLLYTAMLFAGNPPGDGSKAAVDGPYVFHRDGKIVVKSIERRDTGLAGRTAVFEDHHPVLLSCYVAEKGYRFSFLLRDSLSVQPDQYPLPAKMLVASDIEGNFEGFRMILMGAKVIDRDFRWIFGKGHLVLNGDFFDRGNHVTEELWLIYKLEAEAEKAGGKVHFILGNHEILNLQGNTEYVQQKYLDNTQLIGEEYKHLFDANSELGRWLRTKNAVEKIGDFVFCHGGISPELVHAKLSLSDINRIARQNCGKPQELISGASARAVFDMQTGIFWYREAAKNQLTTEQVDAILAYAGAKRMIIGHTLVTDLTALYGGRVICTDLFHEDNLRRGFMKSLWVEGGIFYGIDSKGEKSLVYSVTTVK